MFPDDLPAEPCIGGTEFDAEQVAGVFALRLSEAGGRDEKELKAKLRKAGYRPKAHTRKVTAEGVSLSIRLVIAFHKI